MSTAREEMGMASFDGGAERLLHDRADLRERYGRRQSAVRAGPAALIAVTVVLVAGLIDMWLLGHPLDGLPLASLLLFDAVSTGLFGAVLYWALRRAGDVRALVIGVAVALFVYGIAPGVMSVLVHGSVGDAGVALFLSVVSVYLGSFRGAVAVAAAVVAAVVVGRSRRR